MRNIVSPLDGIRSPLGQTGSPLSLYAVQGLTPEFAIDFARDRYFVNSSRTTFSDAVTHTRASSATYIDENGLVKTAAINEPRLGHHVWDGSAWVNEGLRHEGNPATNRALHSEDFSNAAYQKSSNITVTANHGASPTGAVNATRLQFTAGNRNTRFVQQFLTGSISNATHLVSKWVRSTDGSQQSFSLKCTHAGVADYFSPEMVADGTWRRFSFSQPFGAGGTGVIAGIVSNAAGDPFDVEVWGLQVEFNASQITSDIITGASQVTRAADVLSIPAENLPYNTTAMSMQMDGLLTYSDLDNAEQIQLVTWQREIGNRIYWLISTDGFRTGQFRFTQRLDGSFNTCDSAFNAISPGVDVPLNIAARHGASFLNAAISGSALTEQVGLPGIPDILTTPLDLGRSYMGSIRKFRMWGQDISNAGIAEATG